MTTKLNKLDDVNYVRFKDFVLEQTGLHFPEKKRGDLERAVMNALKQTDHKSVEDYFESLQHNHADGEMDKLVALLTVGETYFYRDEKQLRLLQDEILPKLITDRTVTTRRLRIWSAGCSTGEEAYSIAIILRELIPYINTWDVQVIATDINRPALKQAEMGRYGQWSFRTMPEAWLDKYFFVSSKDQFHISDAIKKLVRFEYLNLKDKAFPLFIASEFSMDLIICRNVTIYFDQQTTDQLMENFGSCLVDDGWLLLGASDPIPSRKKYWTRNHSGVFIYQKKSADHEIRRKPRDRNTNKKPERSGKEVDDTLTESRILIEVGQPLLAADKLVAKLKNEPKSVEALFLMAKAAVARGQLEIAKKWAEELLAIDKLNVRTYYLLSAIYQGLEDEKKAIGCLKKTVFLDKEFIPGYFSLGCLYKKNNRRSMAEKNFKTVVRLMVGRKKDEIVPETTGTTYGTLLEVAKINLKKKE